MSDKLVRGAFAMLRDQRASDPKQDEQMAQAYRPKGGRKDELPDSACTTLGARPGCDREELEEDSLPDGSREENQGEQHRPPAASENRDEGRSVPSPKKRKNQDPNHEGRAEVIRRGEPVRTRLGEPVSNTPRRPKIQRGPKTGKRKCP